MIASLDPRRYSTLHAPLVALSTTTALVSAAQMNVVELRTWNATATTMSHPDRLIFDLDSGPAHPWEKVVEAAKLTRTNSQELRLASLLKTSGGNGLHLVVPLLRRHTWAASKEFAKSISNHLATTIPVLFSAILGTKCNR